MWLLPATFLLAFLVYPLTKLIEIAWSNETLTELTDGGLWQVATLAAGQAIASAAIALIIGLPATGVLARYEFRGRSVILALATVPFVLPTVVVALGFRGLFDGVLDPGIILVVLAHSYINMAVVIRVVGAGWGQIDQRMVLSARALGSSSWRAFRTVTLPIIRPSIISAAIIIFIFSFTSLGIVVILGDGATTRTLEQVILRQTSVLLNFPGAVAATIIQLAVVIVALVAAARLSRPSITTISPQRMKPHRRSERWWVGIVSAFTGMVILTPIASVLIASLAGPDGITIQWWQSVIVGNLDNLRLTSPLAALTNSITIAVATAVIAAIIGGAAAVSIMGKGKVIAGLVFIPLGISAATLGLGIILAFGRPPLDFRDLGVLIPMAHSLVAVPLVVAVAAPALRSVDPRRFFVAATLGAGPTRAWLSTFGPSLQKVMLAAGGLAGAVSLGEFGAASLLTRADSPTVPVYISKLLAKPGEQAYASAAVLGVILMAITISLVLLIDRLDVDQSRKGSHS